MQSMCLQGNNRSALLMSISLGQIIDKKLVQNEQTNDIVVDSDSLDFSSRTAVPYTEYILLDSRTGIVSHGFSVLPYRNTNNQWMTYGNWQGIDQYTSNKYGAWYSPNDYSVSMTTGYTGTLYSSDVRAYGLTLSSTNKYTQTVTTDDNFQIDPWTAKYIRPIIVWDKASYSATYEFYCYNSFDNSYSYKTVNLTGENSAYVTKRNQTWIKVNNSHNPNAILPSRPNGFWLE